MKILVTGGCGYIGSHTVVDLLERGNQVVIIDNLSNSNREIADKIKYITGVSVKLYAADLLDLITIDKIFSLEKFTCCIHFAGLKAVGESVADPLKYYDNNVSGTINLLKCCNKYNVNEIVFSSSATVYGNSTAVPFAEDAPVSAVNPYGQTKIIIENILGDYHRAKPQTNIAILRYFNPIGAHKSGIIGESPNGIPNNLAPYIMQVAAGNLPHLNIFGNDYDTKDGTCIRDYIHVCDLSRGHFLALEKLKTNCGIVTYNLGTGHGYSVFDVLNAFNDAVGRKLPYKLCDRRAGDAPVCYADVTKAKKELNFSTQLDLNQMAIDSWNYQYLKK